MPRPLVSLIGFPVKTPIGEGNGGVKPTGPMEGPGPKITWPGGKYPFGKVKEFGREIVRVFGVEENLLMKIHETIIREIILFAKPIIPIIIYLFGPTIVVGKSPDGGTVLRETDPGYKWPTGWAH